MTSFELRSTADGSVTFFSPEFGETFHSVQGAWQEAECKFVQPTHLREQAPSAQTLHLLDVCYGLGYNTAAALVAIWSLNPDCRVVAWGLERDRPVPLAALDALRSTVAAQQSPDHPTTAIACDRTATVLAALAAGERVDLPQFQGQVLWGDARQAIATIPPEFQAEAIFLDPFSPPRCPQLWTVEFLAQVVGHLAPGGRLATYSCAPAVRSALALAGLSLGASKPFGRRWPGTVAGRSPQGLPPLSLRELEHLQTRAAVPYRDPSGRDGAQEILDRHRAEQATSPLEPTSRWKRRWFGDCRAKH